MTRLAAPRERGDSLYWNRRGRAEVHAAIACADARIASIHVELATRCLKRAQGREQEAEP